MSGHNPRQIWLCADDYGISPGVNTAIRDLIVRGRLNATSVMVVAPEFNAFEAQALAALNATKPRAAIGLHVVLSAPFRPLSADFAPLRDGAFPALHRVLLAAMRRGLDAAALRAEVDSQFDAFAQAFGRMPDFIDGHQHVQLFPQIDEAVLAAAKAKAPHAWLRQCGRATPLTARLDNGKALLLDTLSRRFRRRAMAAGIRTNPAFAGAYGFDEGADFGKLFARFLSHLPDGGLIMCHPGFVDAPLRRLDPLTTLREREYAFFAGEAFPELLARHGLALA
jgi:predicted glycoside hydrolase/deacetylase ChbG (UPF0249 family)